MGYKWVLLIWLPLLAAGADRRYIVELSGDPIATHVANESKRTGKRIAMDSQVAETRRQQIRSEQKQLRAALKSLDVKILDQTETTSNTLIVSMPDSLVDRVAALPGVKRVHKERPVRMNLDHAVPLLKAAQAWAASGGVAKAGLGVKIGLIDSGIDIKHPGMQDSTLQVPDGYPKVNTPADTAFTNSKVIVARNYVNLFDPSDLTAQDSNGHGTGTAMAAAGAQNTSPFGVIIGVAPKAWLGAYKALGADGSGTNSGILKALDDAVADGMDVINLSLNQLLPQPLETDPVVAAIERASAAGVVIVCSAGNGASAESFGFDPSMINSAGAAPSAITVGASYNDRFLAPGSVQVGGGPVLGALTGDEDGPDTAPVTGPLFDVATLDQAGDACLPFPLGSLAGKIAFIIRSEATGGCTFETKLNDVGRAGAIAALMYNVADRDLPPGGFAAGTATLPAVMVTNSDGVAIKKQLTANPNLTATLNFQISVIPYTINGVTNFSSEGPNLDLSIKPDLVAVGTDITTATQASDENGELYDPSGYQVELDGTSFSSPLVAGAVGVVKSFRPGLTSAQYRSLVINTADPLLNDDGSNSDVMASGAGRLNLQTAVTSTFAAVPSNLSFRSGGANPNLSKTLTISNVGTASESYSLAVAPFNRRDPVPTLGVSTLTIQPGQSTDVPVTFSASNLAPGPYQGFVTIRGSLSGVLERVPYWYAVPSDDPAYITPLYVASVDDGFSARRGARVDDAILFRVMDISGIVLPNVQPVVTAVSGGGSVINTISVDPTIASCDPTDFNEICFAGGFDVSVRLGTRPGPNIFEIKVGNLDPFDIEIDGN